MWHCSLGSGFQSTVDTLQTCYLKCLGYAWFSGDAGIFLASFKTGLLLLILGSIYSGCWKIQCWWLLEWKNKHLQITQSWQSLTKFSPAIFCGQLLVNNFLKNIWHVLTEVGHVVYLTKDYDVRLNSLNKSYIPAVFYAKIVPIINTFSLHVKKDVTEACLLWFLLWLKV